MDAELARLVVALRGAADRREPMLTPDEAGRLRAVLDVVTADHAGAAPTDEAADRPLAVLTDCFGLDEIDRRLLVVAAASDCDPNLALLLGLLDGRGGPSRPTVALALELVGLPTMSAVPRLRFAEGSLLRRHRLITLAGTGLLLRREIEVPERVIRHLLGDDTPDPDCAAMAVIPVRMPVAGVAELSAALRLGNQLTYIHDRLSASGLTLAADALAELGVEAFVVDLRRRPAATALPEALGNAAREAGLTERVLVVLGAGALDEDPAALWEQLANAPVPVIAVGESQWQAGWLRWMPYLVQAPRTTPEQRRMTWSAALSGLGPALDDAGADDTGWTDLLALNMPPEQIVLVVQAAATRSAAEERPLHVHDLRDAARQVGRRVADNAASALGVIDVDFEDLILPADTLDTLREIVGWARHRDQVLAQGSVAGKGVKGRGIVALFGGSPGTGKTLAAQVIASHLGFELLTVDLSSLIDKYIGETEKNLEKVFQQAESMNCVLFFDEADAIFGSRSQVQDAHDRYANQEVAYLLQRLEMFDGLAILATNLRGNIDVAFSRRLHFIVNFPDPDLETRTQLWTAHLESVAATDPADPIDPAMLGELLEFNGGEIRNVVLAAVYQASIAGEQLGLRHVARAVRREFTKLARMMPPRAALGLGLEAAVIGGGGTRAASVRAPGDKTGTGTGR